MAYLTLMASVAEHEVEALRQETSLVLHPTFVTGASHLLSYWVTVQPFGQLLNQAVDGGEQLHQEFWHPLRPPMVHHPSDVRSLTEQIAKACENLGSDLKNDDWLSAEVDRLLSVFRHAANSGECVVTALDMPGDEKQAKRVRIPWKPPLVADTRQPWWRFW
ncbi:MAG TPA: hypothetical protein VK137_12125 [Planctomycetaceae bacterium]|nr:hypothetical protein [Planctomycetaceae bacterium]